MRWKLVILFLCISLYSNAAPITQVLIEGLKNVQQQEIFDVIETKVGDELNSAAVKWTIQNDVKAIYALGFFKDVVPVSQEEGDEIKLIFVVEEKNRITAFRYEGNEVYKPKKLNKEINYTGKERLFLDDATVERYKTRILEYYTKQSYPNTEITWRSEPGAEPETAEVVFEIKEGARLPVREVVFSGNTVIDDRRLQKRIQTKESWWFIIKRHYNESEANLDVLRIERTYWELGYLDAKITVEEPEEIEDGLRVTFKVEEGQPYTLGETFLTGNTLFTSEELLSKISSKPGDVFSYTRIQEDETKMMNLYLAQGYLDAWVPKVEDQWQKDTENHIVDLRIPIVEGERKFLGKVEIQGVVTIDENTPPIPTKEGEFKTRENVIRREFRMKEGEPLDWTKVVETDRELVNTDLFKSRGFGARDQLNLVPGFRRVQTNEENVENLLLQLEETQTGLLSFGGGLSTSFGPSVFANYTERNIMGYGLRGSVTGEVGRYRNRVVLSLFDPHIFDSDYSLDWDIYYIDTEGFGGRRFDEQRIGTAVTIGDEITDDLSLLYGFKIEEADLQPSSGRRGALDPATIPSIFNLGTNLTTSLLFGVVYDTRDFVIDPSEGLYSRSTVEVAGLTDNEFVKFSTENNFYQEFFDRFVLAFSTKLDIGHAYGDPGFIPLQERYFVGGARSIRGFDEGGIGESAVILFSDPARGGFRTYLGGEAAFVGSTELRYPFTEIFQGVVFLDFGSVWPEIGDIDPTDFRVSTGAGLRVRIPGFNNALLRLDFAVPIRKESGDDTEYFHFGFSQAF